ncbi:metallophosphoesterase [Jannaschia sp. LMIT008]|uniref:metallophosphoesterase n=1 Tax=Jannaschia maritima TaxID=3032585 RepID=UPI002811C806|nr:metallophosphoesterase [Jannaschia sp. LMIT008]
MASGILSRLLGRGPKDEPSTPVAVDQDIWLIGDVHGCIDPLDRLLARVDADRHSERSTIVFLGDYVDRGPASKAVLDRLSERLDGGTSMHAAVALVGNHERMMLEFLEEPVQRGRRWLRFGGIDTLASFGVGGITVHATPAELRDAADRLAVAAGADTLAMLHHLPTRWRNGNVVCVHAGLDPGAPVDGQSDEVAVWGHPDFMTVPRTDGLWIAHGHTIVDRPHAAGSRIATDTGVYRTGRLTAAHLRPGAAPAFVTVD